MSNIPQLDNRSEHSTRLLRKDGSSLECTDVLGINAWLTVEKEIFQRVRPEQFRLK